MANILIITPYFKPAKEGGGGQISIENLVDLLATNFNKIHVLCYNFDLKNKNSLSSEYRFSNNNIEILYLDKFTFFKIIKFINKSKYEFIYFNSFFSPICLFFNFFFYYKHKIISPKGEFYKGAIKQKYFQKIFVLNIFKFFIKAITFHSTSINEINSIKNYFPNFKIILARDIPSIFIQKNIAVQNNLFNITYISRIEPKKNLLFIIELLSNLKINLNFDIWGEIGDEDYFNLINKSIKNLPKNINCIYKGKLALMDAKFKFSNYNLFILPTKGENYGHVIFESLSCGCPILLSENTTPWNNLETNLVGYNISLDNKQGWIDKIIYFSRLNITEREIYAENCKNYIKNNIKYDDILQENLLLFN